MTIHAAGILIVNAKKEALFLKRGPGGDYPGTWGLPGGKLEAGEHPEQAARRECQEEIGSVPEGELSYWTRSNTTPTVAPELPGAAQPGELVDFTTFVVHVPESFPVQIEGEHVGWAWAPIDQPPEPLHPGVRVALEKFGADETWVAQKIVSGELTSPQQYENIWLFDVRITGTGTAYRKALDEFVWRDPSLYLNPQFLERCLGLPVIVEHPPTDVLTTKEFANRAIGTIVKAYIKGDEVWGVAKIYDQSAAEMMRKEQLSTSPAVVFRDPGVNAKMTLEDGSALLIEGKPSLLDHLAICEVGVWDKGGAPAGVVNAETSGDVAMTEEEQIAADKARKDAEMAERDDRARKDAEAGEKLDKLLTCLDSINKRLDSLEAGEEVRRDKGRKDDDDAKAKKADEEVGEEVGEPRRVAADKARKDAEEEEAMRAAEDRARKDSQELADRLARVERMLPRQITDAEYAEMSAVQAKADKVYQAFGDAAPRPLQGEDLLAYRRRLANGLKSHSSVWSKVNISGFDTEALGVAEAQIYSDAMTAAHNPTDVPDGQLREIRSTDETGRRMLTFVGKPSAWLGSFSANRRYMTSINTNVGR